MSYDNLNLPGFTVHRRLPQNIEPEDETLFKHELERTFPKSSAYVYHNCKVNGQGLVLKRLWIYKPSLRHLRTTKISIKYYASLIWLSLWKKPIAKGMQSYYVSDTWSTGYFHWICDTLPIIHLISKHLPEFELIIPQHLNADFIPATLDILSIRYRYLGSLDWVRSTTHITHDLLAKSGNYNPRVMLELRTRLLLQGDNSTDIESTALFISRSKAERRRLLNESEILEFLFQKKVKVVCFEDLTFSQQVELCSQAKLLIGVHGAGLTNMLFMPKGSKVIELRASEDGHNNCYFALANVMEHEYYYINCLVVEDKNDHIGDFIVDRSTFKDVLRTILNG